MVGECGLRRPVNGAQALQTGRQRHQEGHARTHPGPHHRKLLYATDMADRLEKVIIPSLRAGFVVLTDRYIYSTMALAMVRGAEPGWI